MTGVFGDVSVGVGPRTPPCAVAATSSVSAEAPPNTPLTHEQRTWLRERISAAQVSRQGVVQDGRIHGTVTAYRNGCRCEDCRGAERERGRARRLANAPSTHALPNDRKTHCVRGHEFTEENTCHSKRGWRVCRACRREYGRDYMRSYRAKSDPSDQSLAPVRPLRPLDGPGDQFLVNDNGTRRSTCVGSAAGASQEQV